LHFSESKCPKEWPTQGNVVFSNVSMCYGDIKVLRNVTFQVNPGEKIGIIGRSGAGKSSIIQAIFRMADLSGDILIDDININSVAIAELRNSLAIIPQNPTVFKGTLRNNLDIYNLKPDEVLWSALNSVSFLQIYNFLFLYYKFGLCTLI